MYTYMKLKQEIYYYTVSDHLVQIMEHQLTRNTSAAKWDIEPHERETEFC
jgi:hypothetical protein